MHRVIATELTEKQRTVLLAEIKGMAQVEIARWMWYIFPQIDGRAFSSTSKYRKAADRFACRNQGDGPSGDCPLDVVHLSADRRAGLQLDLQIPQSVRPRRRRLAIPQRLPPRLCH